MRRRYLPTYIESYAGALPPWPVMPLHPVLRNPVRMRNALVIIDRSIDRRFAAFGDVNDRSFQTREMAF